MTQEQFMQAFQAAKDGLFADLRKAGVFEKKQKEPEGAPPAKVQSTSSAATSTDDVRLMLDRQRKFDRAVGGVKMSDGALSHMERAFAAEQPEDVQAWARAYLVDFGLVGAGGSSPSSPDNQSTQATEKRPPVTNVPGPAGQAPSDVRDPYSLTEDDVNAMIRRDGMHRTGVKLMEALRAAPRRRLLLRRR